MNNRQRWFNLLGKTVAATASNVLTINSAIIGQSFVLYTEFTGSLSIVFSDSATVYPLTTATTLTRNTESTGDINVNFLGDFANLTYLDCENKKIKSASLGSLTTLSSILLANNELTTIDITNNVNLLLVQLFNNNLNVAAVNHVLNKLVLFGLNNGFCYLNLGTNAAPTGQGTTDKATLISRGWTVLTN